MNRKEIAQRKMEVRKAAAVRWKEKAPEFAITARRLARGGPLAAASPERAASFIAREILRRAVSDLGVGFERRIGPTLDWEDTPTTVEAKKGALPVARIVELLAPGRIGEGFATGFVVPRACS